MTRQTASCRCGQVRATVTGEPARVSVCHCLNCQQRSGSALAVQKPRFPVWEERKHDWVEISGENVEHTH